MTTNKRMFKKIRDLIAVGKFPHGVYSRYDEYVNVLCNQIAIYEKGTDNLIPYEQETFAKRALIESGAVGYDNITKRWYFVFGEDVNEYGNPVYLTLVTANGVSMYRTADYEPNEDGAYKINALPLGGTCLGALIEEATDFMTNCDIAMRQNLEACKTPYIVVCKDEDLRLSYESAIQAKQTGQAVLLVSADLGEGLKAVDITTQYLVDKFGMARDRERDILLTKLGILTANDDKRERVQSSEVNATLGEASDYIYLLIDTFNKQMDTYGLPFEMRYNGSMEEIYLNNEENDNVQNKPNVNNVEKGENIND